MALTILYYQFLGQLKNFSDPWYVFSVKLGYPFRVLSGVKKCPFLAKKADFQKNNNFLKFIKTT